MHTNLSILPEFELLDVTGKDASKFLQGQLTCDVEKMQPNQFYLGAVCNPKGQMYTNFVIAPIQDGFRLRLAKNQAQNVIDSLKKYAVFFKANMQLQEQYRVFGVLPKSLLDFELTPFKLEQSADEQTLYWPDGRIEYWQLKPSDTKLNISEKWHKADIKAGIYWLEVSEKEQWVPQMIHWQKLGGVSFTKGCYTGQEVIARLEHLGKSKRNLVRFTCSTTQERGNRIYNQLEKSIGVILNFQDDVGLAMLNEKANALFTQTGVPITKIHDVNVITKND